MFTLQFADTASSSGSGSSQHVTVIKNSLSGDFKWSGSKALPIPADAAAPRVGSITLTKNFVGGNTTATFYLKGQNGSYYLQTGAVAGSQALAAVTFTNGQSKTWINLPWQNYYFEEDPISGYTTNNDPTAPILLDSSHLIQSVTVTNTQSFGSIEITKTNLRGTDTANLYLWKTNGAAADTQVLPTRVVGNGVTTATWTDLAYDTYYVTEDFVGITTNVYTYIVANPVATGIVVDGATLVQRTVSNTALTGSIEITKTNLRGTDTANLYLWKTNGAAADTQVLPTRVVGNGVTTATWTDLAYDTYYVTEDFVGITTNVYTYIVANPVATGIVVDGATLVQRTVSNTALTGSIEITKTNLRGTDTANLYLWKTNGAAADTQVLPTRVVGNGVTTATWTDLAYDTYYVTEDFVGITTNVYTYTVANPVATGIVVDGATLVQRTVSNTALTGTINLIKYVNNNIPPNGSSFTINWTGSDGTLGSIVLDSINDWAYSGFELFSGITYIFTEDINNGFSFVKITNDGNDYTNPSFEFIAVTGENDSIAFYNATATIIVHKTDSVTGADVSGATYDLFVSDGSGGYKEATDAWGNNIDPQVTDSGGNAIFDGLLFDTYYVKEISESSGYYLDPTYHEVVVNASTINREFSRTVEVTDVPIPPPTPPVTPPPVTPPPVTPPPVTPPPVITVAGLTTPPGIIQVLAFTGLDPIIPISGGSAVIGGLAMILATLRRRMRK